ncbi:4a-hydroxytetrahydrobiopterin dehydratase [Gordonia hydrophobica]|uniref:Putative pterin-4-alpha-carbinolamine dehydratase n=1 Tax=Gordonia hydrophobica TaxID=40516 RepID=A0ABZ2U1E6_9ACTN|nr:4a-hydroxytetrahydrobiopterin dehydratase [Gordonia hydrophobica]MBM7368509.1 4a-hydroxytetrahydrobiopterin dehydratase [Gordonia hydrophobica]
MSDYQPEPLTDRDADAQTSGAWTVVDGALVATFRPGTMVRGLDMVTAVVAAAEEANHHPDIDLRYPTVTYRLTTHSAGQLTSYDVALAQRIDAIAAEKEIEAA